MMEIRTLSQVRNDIDAIDPQVRELLMRRLDCSYEVALAKLESGDYTIYRADREEEILSRLGKEVPGERRAGYLAVLRKIMETSRMYQYGIIYDRTDGLFEKLSEGIAVPEHATRTKLRLTRPDCPNAMSSILAMIGDYGYNMDRMELIDEDRENKAVTFELTVIGDLNDTHMKKLMFQLSMESRDFRILRVW